MILKHPGHPGHLWAMLTALALLEPASAFQYNVSVPAHSPILNWWPNGVWNITRVEPDLAPDGTRIPATVASASSQYPMGLSFAFVGSRFMIDGSWFDSTSSSSSSSSSATVTLTVDGKPLPVDLTMPLSGTLEYGAHAVNVSLNGGNVTVGDVMWSTEVKSYA